MAAEATGFKVLVLGGTVAPPVLQVLTDLTNLTGFAVLVWCPQLELRELRSVSRLPVQELDGRTSLLADRIYLLPSDRRVTIDGDQLVVGGSDRGPFDHVLRSVADTRTTDSIGVVLAGRGTDGSLGIKRIKEAGGLTIAQLPDGVDAALPSAAIEGGFIDLVLPVDKIATHVAQLARSERATNSTDAQAIDETLRAILTLIRLRTGHDFASYKRATLYRRLERRMQVCECGNFESYHRYLQNHPQELPHVLRDFLISVTNFFRDPDAFAALTEQVIPKLFHHKRAHDHVRVWVAGCASGEEAYSIGMLLLEHADTLESPPHLQIFATDIDESALAEARAGIYPDAIAVDVSPERLARFFTRENDQYRVTKELREMMLFSPHNVLRDPPFSRLDLVTCRNLLIYLDRDAQTRVLTTFHFGLRLAGMLFLGSSESAESSSMFGVIDAHHRIFGRQGTAPIVREPLVPLPRWQAPMIPALAHPPRDRGASAGEVHHRLVEYFAPPSVLLDAELDVVHVSEHAGRFMQIAGGEPTRQLLRLVHPGLRLELHTAIYAARQTGSERRIVRFEDNGQPRQVELRVRKVDSPELGRGTLLVTFEDVPIAPESVISGGSAIEPVVHEIEDELQHTREQLRNTVEQYETSLEELKASNEELQAINEELRSATEELEASKEELQSVNEELTTLNHELKIKVDEVSHANSDLQNLMMSTEIGVVFLDRSLNIKRFTPRVQDVFNIMASDIGRPLSHLTHRLHYDDLAETAQRVLQTLRIVDKEVVSRAGRSYLVRWLPYRSIDDRIEGVVITLIDVSDLREAVSARQRSEHALLQVEERLRLAVRIAPIAVLSFDHDRRLTWAYVMGHELASFQLDIANIFTATDVATLQAALVRVGETRTGTRIELGVRTGQDKRTFDFRVEPSPTGTTAVGFDITQSKAAENSLRETDRRKDEFLATLSHELRNPLTPLKIALDVARLVGNDPEQRERSLAVMERQVDMLSHLVDELLDLSRITQGKVHLDLELIDVGVLVERAVEATSDLIAANQHDLRVQLPSQSVKVWGDMRRLTQVLGNLLTNAAKYTPSPGAIELVAMVDASNKTLAIRVSDNGIGIPVENLHNIFDIFVQTRDAAGRSKGGLGIGLNVVRRLVELQGGIVMAASDGPGRGSAFTIQLPVKD